MPLPESVKVALATFVPDATVTGDTFDMNLGINEVAVMLSLYYWWKGVPAAGGNFCRMAIWRKSDEKYDPAGLVFNRHTDIIWDLMEIYNFVTESVWCGGKGHVIFPWPVILIRPPRLLAQVALMTTPIVSARIYYLIQKVSDEELAKLMVKDHA